jgi:transposase InsO family protein
MRDNSQDLTLKRNYLSNYRFLMSEYELVKAKKHPIFRFAEDFYKAHNTDRRAFRKYYVRYKNSGDDASLLPQKRGPKWKTRRAPDLVEEKVKELREKGMNRYEIVLVLRPILKELTPSPSGIYAILKRHNINRLKPPMKETKRRIIKEKAGEMAHIDCHHLSRSLVLGKHKRRYLVSVIDACTRIAWAEVVDDIKALTVMFATLRCFNILSTRYSIKFAEVLTDNGPEVGTKESKQKLEHPFERLLMELGVKHRYTRPYRPQTNGKVERFWKTLEEDLIYETTFESIEQFKDELMQYLLYYNEHRPHSALGGETPAKFNENCPRII